MKKIIAILLLSVHLFNLAGYSFLFHYLMAKADERIVKRADDNRYNDADLLQIKVPLNMPYISSNGFERVDGQLEYKGIHYNYVKQKVSNDTLYVLCLPNERKTELSKAKTNFTKTANDIPTNKKGAETLKKSSAANEYNTAFNTISLHEIIVAPTTYPSRILLYSTNAFTLIPEQPPKAFC